MRAFAKRTYHKFTGFFPSTLFTENNSSMSFSCNADHSTLVEREAFIRRDKVAR